ncbi:hypothetical protein ACFL34_02910 [Candidatus Sumerlaeota bacterium]
MNSRLEVDEKGLAKILERKGKPFILHELIQNAWDQNITEVDVSLSPVNGKRQATVIVEDNDPEGFADLTHAYTLFAESNKKGDPEKRGRFNIGDKLVLAVSEEAEISTTKGTILFDRGGRHQKRRRRERGSRIQVTIKMTRADIEDCQEAIRLLIPPDDIETRYNGELLHRPELLETIEETLPTIICDDDGNLRESKRKAIIEVFEPSSGDEHRFIYEMGIPVVETDIPYHINVGQKIPLNMDRDNVRPAYAKTLKAIVLNATAHLLDEEESSASWVSEALGDNRCEAKTAKAIVNTRFGEDAVINDPNDPEAAHRATAMGHQVIFGGALSKEAWAKVRESKAMQTTSDVAGTESAFSRNGEGKTLNTIPEREWSEGMKQIVEFAKTTAEKILGHPIAVTIANERLWRARAAFDGAKLIVNYGRVGPKLFNNGITESVLQLLIHEFAHDYERNHLSDDFHRATCRVGAAMAMLAVKHPDFFKAANRLTMAEQ